ncbi:hypothetical protein BUALT_Bualt08G0004700 [Buddleja alternifolia]|uniref:RRM domain-containing protein n=1 Tax=Buddleja alternifolia TaxID=168488 RepID=A0AAV6XA14_9LAMI|nr:hypothetical protein BUALT_Bualt08G0004700 [Buddleja alternifolia]
MAYQQQQQQQGLRGPSSGSGQGGFQYMNSPFGDTTFTKVFVGGLAWETQSETLRQYFEQFGEILEAVVIADKNTGRSKGYGFVTFRDPESARRACADPTPIIDGRRANCNLASLGRPRPAVPFGVCYSPALELMDFVHVSEPDRENWRRRIRSPAPYLGGLPTARGAYMGSFGYQQPVTYGFQQGLMYSPYGYTSYNPEYAYSQGVYNPYGGSQQYLQVYGVPGAVNTTMYPYSQLSQAVPGSHNYTTLPGYAIPGHQMLQFGGPSVNAMTTTSVPTVPPPYPTVSSPHEKSPYTPGALQHLFHSSHHSCYLGILLNSFRVVVQTKMLGEGFVWIAAGLRTAVLLLEWRASNLALQIIHLAFYRSYIVTLTREVNVRVTLDVGERKWNVRICASFYTLCILCQPSG